MDRSRRDRIDLLAEHIESRKAWANYVYAATEVHRADAERTDDFIAHLQGRLKEAKENPRPDP